MSIPLPAQENNDNNHETQPILITSPYNICNLYSMYIPNNIQNFCKTVNDGTLGVIQENMSKTPYEWYICTYIHMCPIQW